MGGRACRCVGVCVCVCVCVCVRGGSGVRGGGTRGAGGSVRGVGVSGGTSPSHGLDRLVADRPSRTCSAEEAAPRVLIVRDALAPCFSTACLLTRDKAGDFARRLAHVDLTTGLVTFGIRRELYPLAICFGCGEH